MGGPYSDHASILHRYGDMAPQILDARTWTRKTKRGWRRGRVRGRGRKMGNGKRGKEEGEGEAKGKVE